MSSIKVPNSGNVNAKILIIGEAPGADEVREKRPFVGAAGTLLRSVLAESGIDPERDVYYANLSQERPPNNELRTFFNDQGVPNATLIEGMSILKSEIEQINPNLIIPVGNYPLRFATGRGTWKDGYSGISTYRGSILQGTAFVGGRKCLPTYHPAAALRQYALKHIMRADLGRAAVQQQFSEIRRPRKFILVDPRGPERDLWAAWLTSPAGTTPADVGLLGSGDDSWWTSCPSSSFLSADIEYIGSKLLCLGATRHSDISIVLATRSPGDIEFIRDILLSGVPLCFQNAMFDCSILEYFYQIPCLRYLKHDTMIAMHACYTEFPKDLGFIASLFTEQPVWFEVPNPKKPTEWMLLGKPFWDQVRKAWGTPDLAKYEEIYLPYNGVDVWVTHSAMEQMLADDLTDKDFRRTYEYEMSLVKPLWEIGKRGVRIDTPALETLKTTLQSEATTLLGGLALYNGGKAVNVKSPPQVAAFIYTQMGLPPVGPKTPTGRWKMDDDTIALLLQKARDERQRTALTMVRKARERLDLISKFCEIELDEDGRMRCHYDPAKTETGRLASRKFYPTGRGTNLQNVPKDTRVRAVFVPDRGKLFAYADLKSAESLVVAHITGDTEMLRLHSPEYMDGMRDGHKYVASFLLDKPIDRVTKDDRYLGKRVRHAGNYGLGWFRLQQLINGDAQTTGVSVDAAQAKRLITKYRQLHPMLQVWWDRVLADLCSTHTIYTRFRRKRVFYGRPSEVLPEAIAYDPQGTVAEVLNRGLLRLDSTYYIESENFMRQWDAALNLAQFANYQIESQLVNELGYEMLLQVHDAIGFQVPEVNADKVLPIVQRLMNVPVQITRRGVEPYEITIPVDIQVGYNWGESDEEVPGSRLTKDGKPAKNPLGLKAWKNG